MPDERGLPQLAGGAVVTVGTFDGVHLGHRDILRRVSERASALGVPGLLVTFRPHPLDVVNPTAAPMLLTPDAEQRDALADSGPLLVVVLPALLHVVPHDGAWTFKHEHGEPEGAFRTQKQAIEAARNRAVPATSTQAWVRGDILLKKTSTRTCSSCLSA